MSLGSNAAARIRPAQEAIGASQRIASEARRVVAMNAEALWGDLVTALESHVTEFADELPLAREKNLCATRLGRDNLTIQTSIYPLLKFGIIFVRERHIVTGRITENMSGLSAPRCLALNDVGITVDRNLHPYFTDGERLLAPVPLAGELMQSVYAFFEKAAGLPLIFA